VKKSELFWFSLILSFLAVCLLCWSYTLVDPNLVLLPFKWSFALQQWYWQWGANRLLLASLYLGITLSWWGVWAIFQSRTTGKVFSLSQWIVTLVPIILIFLFTYNALSHDIFNYLFNAKMVVVFQANPHHQVALDFAYDPWVRFMHNVHTPAPYGYGWTLVSLIPFVFSIGKFLSAYFLMKMWMILGLALYLLTAWWILRKEKLDCKDKRFALLALHPLLLIETVVNGHNDVWMMWPALLAIGLIKNRKKNVKTFLMVVSLWLFSISIKWASVVLLPILVGLWLEPWLKKIWKQKMWLKLIDWLAMSWAEWSTLFLLLPLFSSRSQWFHPWYLIWALAFLPFVKWRWLKAMLIGLSITSVWRVVPWILNNLEYSPLIQAQMRCVTWSGAVIGLVVWLIFSQLKKNQK